MTAVVIASLIDFAMVHFDWCFCERFCSDDILDKQGKYIYNAKWTTLRLLRRRYVISVIMVALWNRADHYIFAL